ncbi:MAG: hypothetical protein MUD14_03405 [Hydrococcus sp. Prado102]|nr:hypothetical protein [Hydrococcus sp. Prado102]
MKLDRLFQSLVLASATIVAIAISAKSEEVNKDIRGEDITQRLEKLTLNESSKNITQPSENRVSRDRILGQTPNNPLQREGIIPITGVEINPTESGVEVILQNRNRNDNICLLLGTPYYQNQIYFAK